MLRGEGTFSGILLGVTGSEPAGDRLNVTFFRFAKVI